MLRISNNLIYEIKRLVAQVALIKVLIILLSSIFRQPMPNLWKKFLSIALLYSQPTFFTLHLLLRGYFSEVFLLENNFPASS